ncbi:hypothetical protein MYP_1978 [Sporocytophaga myxococcoides]|uniref:Uncharacterized protein n=1 Tax=Sporocytophaga myxococcoides TaxID=153721 RepID=A0A098LCY5_9BACT|nr:hypothetical protein [Sporocytophaga myxococcoides]GAL84750.1 hypothetical protein MYP_1978 [Sporocytophaga myxococcoides]
MNKYNDSDILIYAKAKMKYVNVIKSSEVVVDQFSNVRHEKENKNIRINAPAELEEGEEYKDTVVGTIRGVSIKND